MLMNIYKAGSRVGVMVAGVLHEGIPTGRFRDGEPSIISNSRRTGRAVEEPLSVFSGGRQVFRLPPLSDLSPWEVLRNAEKLLGKPWDLFRSNCEHFVRECYGLKPTSPQLRFWAGLAAALTIVYTVVGGRK